MHLLVRETRGLDEAEAAVDLGQSRADLVFLSFSDSDLGALAASLVRARARLLRRSASPIFRGSATRCRSISMSSR